MRTAEYNSIYKADSCVLLIFSARCETGERYDLEKYIEAPVSDSSQKLLDDLIRDARKATYEKS